MFFLSTGVQDSTIQCAVPLGLTDVVDGVGCLKNLAPPYSHSMNGLIQNSPC